MSYCNGLVVNDIMDNLNLNLNFSENEKKKEEEVRLFFMSILERISEFYQKIQILHFAMAFPQIYVTLLKK